MFRKISIIGIGMFFIVSMITMVLAPPAMAALTDGLKGYFAMDGTLADTSADKWNSGFAPVTYSGGAATYVAGPNGAGDQAVSLVTDSVKIGPGTTGALSAFTFSAWTKFNAAILNSRRIFVIDSNDIDVQLYREKIELWVNDVASYPPLRLEGIPQADQWYYLTTTWESGVGMDIYVDGVLQAHRSPGLTGTFTPSVYTSIGATPWGGAEILKGAMADIALYNRALSTDEVTDLFNQAGNPLGGSQVPEPATVFTIIGGLAMAAYRRLCKRTKRGIRS